VRVIALAKIEWKLELTITNSEGIPVGLRGFLLSVDSERSLAAAFVSLLLPKVN
jgi:hypothetical protein